MENKFIETPEIVHGRLLESVHLTGYTMERACLGLEWLLEEDKWKSIGKGFNDINKFLETIDLSQFKIAVDKRKKLSARLEKMKATQRATAKVLGVGTTTIARDLKDVPNGTKQVIKSDTNKVEASSVPNGTKPPNTLSKSGADVIKAAEKVEDNKPHVSNNSGENEWYTPKPFIDSARKMMGSIDCDPASSEIANKTVNASEYFTIDNNGLNQKWHGNVWMNPPYSQPEIKEFSYAVVDKYDSGKIQQACVLVNNATETETFQKMVRSASAICFPKGRIKYNDKDGNPSLSPLQGQALLYFGKNKDKFIKVFSKHGVVVICQ